MWGTTGMCQGVSMLTVKDLFGLKGTLCVAVGQGNLPKGLVFSEMV